MEAFDGIRQGLREDRFQFFKDVTMPFYGYNRPGAKVSEGVRDSFWRQSMTTSLHAAYFSVEVFSETDTTVDLKKIEVPVLILHGDDDQLVPLPNTGRFGELWIQLATDLDELPTQSKKPNGS
jgi:non-heme chloroperoxidase